MTEIHQIDHFPGAQPVRCSNGWLLAAYPPSNADSVTLLIDAAGTDATTDWNDQPDGTHRLLLMAGSPATQFATIDVAEKQPITVHLNGSTCLFNVLDAKSIYVDGYHGLSYSVLVSHQAGTD